MDNQQHKTSQALRVDDSPNIDQLSCERFQSTNMTTCDTTKPSGIRYEMEDNTDIPEVIKRFEFKSDSKSDSDNDTENVSCQNLHTINWKYSIKRSRI